MSEITHVSDADFETAILKHSGVALVDFYADWCGPCRMLGPVIEQLAKEYSAKPEDNVRFVKVNVDEARATATRFGIRAVPTMIVFKSGTEAERLLGFKPAGEIRSIIEKHRK
ncbi:MAG: thioredoxin [Candidatus Brocadiia bacterium]